MESQVQVSIPSSASQLTPELHRVFDYLETQDHVSILGSPLQSTLGTNNLFSCLAMYSFFCDMQEFAAAVSFYCVVQVTFVCSVSDPYLFFSQPFSVYEFLDSILTNSLSVN
jgi:hypothetical protein